jgi:UDP-N-acetylmuramoyl-L-alanyl-D-glutamate--2,6-diaminopimelate ligase
LRISDRTEAIREAIQMARKEDIVLIAGKGHEQYQILQNGAHPFNEYQIAEEAARSWKKERTV